MWCRSSWRSREGTVGRAPGTTAGDPGVRPSSPGGEVIQPGCAEHSVEDTH